MALKADEAELACAQVHQLGVVEVRPLAISAQELEERDSPTVGGPVRQIRVTRGGVALAVGRTKRATFSPESDLHSHAV